MSRLERSDSLRSDNSKARVSFNKDVHVKRIGGRERGDWNRDMKEAEEVLRKARSVESIAHQGFNSLPRTPKKHHSVRGTHSLERRAAKKQLSPILEADSPWSEPQLYASVSKRDRPMDSQPSERIRRLIVNTEGYLTPLTETRFRRHSTPTPHPDSLPPAPLKKKKSLPEKVKSIFGKKKKDEENKDPLKGRYVQYNGTNGYNVNSNYRGKSENQENKETWLKSLDRRLRGSNKPSNKSERKGGGSSSQEENTDSSWAKSNKQPLREKTFRDKAQRDKPLREKPLRFFGDTEDESDCNGRSRKDEGGYSSATSAKSVVYLHSPAVVDIPGHRLSRRSASREELSPRLDPRKRTTVSRSVSVLAPWRPAARPVVRAKLSSGDETDNAPTRPPRKLVFTGPPFDKSRPAEIHRTTSLYSRDTRAGFYGKTRK